MLAEKLETYGCWELKLPSIPERCRLYGLEPIGLGTPAVESLTSYAIRLAEVHAIHLIDLIELEILPQICERPQKYSLHKLPPYFRVHRWLDGGNLTMKLIAALEKLTSQRDLCSLSLLPINKFFPSNGRLHFNRVWCPACLQEWQENQRTVYEPLIWSIQVIAVCPNHKSRLHSRCYWCGAKQNSLERNSRPGHCYRCHDWLGMPLDQYKRIELSKEEFNWQFWVNQVIGDFLATSPQIDPITRKAVAQSLRPFHQSKITRLARPHTLSRKLQKVEPTLEGFLKNCYRAGVSIPD